MTHILRYDTPVDGFDSEIGFPVSKPVNQGHVRTHTLRRLDFFSATHHGSANVLRETTGQIYAHMSRVGLAPELELEELYHDYHPGSEAVNRIEVRAAFLAWPEILNRHLIRVLERDMLT